MLMIIETSTTVRLACESCGSETTTNPMSFTGARPQEECMVCGAWERIHAPLPIATAHRPGILN
jgi:hypothetical protein